MKADVLDEGIRSPAKVVLSMFRRNINQVVRELLPKVVELHGGMSSQWARKHIEIFTSLGGPFTGTSKVCCLMWMSCHVGDARSGLTVLFFEFEKQNTG